MGLNGIRLKSGKLVIAHPFRVTSYISRLYPITKIGRDYVLVASELAIAGPGDKLLQNREVSRLFLGG